MISRKLDRNHDLILEGSSLATVSDAEQVAQAVKTRLLFYREEWFLDLTAGVPYYQEVFRKPANLANVESLIKAEIVRTPGVSRLIEFSMNFNENTRRLLIAFTAFTEFGEINTSQ